MTTSERRQRERGRENETRAIAATARHRGDCARRDRGDRDATATATARRTLYSQPSVHETKRRAHSSRRWAFILRKTTEDAAAVGAGRLAPLALVLLVLGDVLRRDGLAALPLARHGPLDAAVLLVRRALARPHLLAAAPAAAHAPHAALLPQVDREVAELDLGAAAVAARDQPVRALARDVPLVVGVRQARQPAAERAVDDPLDALGLHVLADLARAHARVAVQRALDVAVRALVALVVPAGARHSVFIFNRRSKCIRRHMHTPGRRGVRSHQRAHRGSATARSDVTAPPGNIRR